MSVNEVKLKSASTEFQVRGTGDPSSRTFAIGNEDHTLGNALRHVLLQNSNIGFAGYSVPHPSEPVVHVRVQTLPKINSTDMASNKSQITAVEALKDSCLTLHDACDILLEEIENILPEVKDDRINQEKFAESNYFMGDDDDNDEVGEECEDYEMEEAY